MTFLQCQLQCQGDKDTLSSLWWIFIVWEWTVTFRKEKKKSDKVSGPATGPLCWAYLTCSNNCSNLPNLLQQKLNYKFQSKKSLLLHQMGLENFNKWHCTFWEQMFKRLQVERAKIIKMKTGVIALHTSTWLA